VEAVKSNGLYRHSLLAEKVASRQALQAQTDAELVQAVPAVRAINY